MRKAVLLKRAALDASAASQGVACAIRQTGHWGFVPDEHTGASPSLNRMRVQGDLVNPWFGSWNS